MIYYFLPGTGIFGGIKVGCQFLELLLSLGASGTIVTPEGRAPEWFATTVPFINEHQAFSRIQPRDVIMFSLPQDYPRLRQLAGTLVCHCQGTDPSLDPVFADPEVRVLTCWKQAFDLVQQRFNRTPIDVGISISDCFFLDGTTKHDTRVGHMPRRGYSITRACMRRNPHLDFIPLNGLHERKVAEKLKQSGMFLATSEGEWFGLPALEAMAAGCLVLSVPVRGGTQYLHDEDNCLVKDAAHLPDSLYQISRPENDDLRTELRYRAVAAAVSYSRVQQRHRLKALKETDLQWLFA